MNNPYSLIFGVEPSEYISRLSQTRDIETSIEDESQRLYMITGVRGSGKTVFLNEIKNSFSSKDDWEVVELSTERDMLTGLIGKLNSKKKLSGLFKKASINLSFFGIGIELKNDDQIIDAEVAIQKMLEALGKSKKRLLILVDEAVDNQYVRTFASVFQILIRDHLPVSLVMTGLYENIDDLQNEKNLTFLHRAPKIHLNPLSIGVMAANYQKNLKVDGETSIKLAQLTRGYSYAFQVLGYCMFENGGILDDAIISFKQYLEEYVYDKIWSELSEKDRQVLYAISKTSTGKVSDIREELGLESNEFSPYKKRLIRKGLIGDENGYAKLLLPLFDEYIKENYY